jgi:hypothetical protein
MTDFEAYRVYCAIKRHFNSDTYDYFKYNKKVNASLKTFEKRKDKYFFFKLATHKDLEGFLVANLYRTDAWVGDLVNQQAADRNYRQWLKRKESLSYLFRTEIEQIDDLAAEIRTTGQHPELFKRYLSGEIGADTLIIINRLFKGCVFQYWKTKLSDPVWIEEYRRLMKLTPFIVFDEDKYKSILVASHKIMEDNESAVT